METIIFTNICTTTLQIKTRRETVNFLFDTKAQATLAPFDTSHNFSLKTKPTVIDLKNFDNISSILQHFSNYIQVQKNINQSIHLFCTQMVDKNNHVNTR